MDIPEEWIKRMASAKDQREEGIRIAVDIGKALKEMSGVRGLHIMLIGWEEALPEIVKALR